MAGFFDMKTTLAIDTATARTQFGILKGDELVWLQIADGANTHGDVLAKFGALAAKEKIDQVIVGMGPGPFTGLRTGIVFAQSFGFAQGLPVHGVSSLDAIAHGINLPEFIVATDARRKELYWAKYVLGKRVGEPLVTSPSEIPSLPIFGEGAMKYALTTDTEHLYPKLISFPNLVRVNEPMYLRHPDAVPMQEQKADRK
jgi:tRNA threonylcarbamoyl adenosine modification protein YeaZ